MSHLHHKVSALVDGELTGSARRRAIQHIQSCPHCHDELEATLALKRRLLGLSAAEPSADLFCTLASVTPDAAQDSAPMADSTSSVRRLIAGASSLSLALLALAYIVGGADDPTVAAVRPPIEEFTAEFAGVSGRVPLGDPAVEALTEVGYRAANPHGAASRGAGTGPRVDLASWSELSTAQGPAHSWGLAAWGLLGAVIIQPGDDTRAVNQLGRAVRAPGRVAYRGVRVIESSDPDGDDSMTFEIEHSPRQGTSFQAVSDGSDPAATFLARGELLRESRLAGEPLRQLVESYDISLLGDQEVAGRRATVVAASSEGQLTAKFWIDEATGLLLRRELYENGRVVRLTTFTELRLTKDWFMSHLPPELPVPSTTSLSMTVASPLDDGGWTSPNTLCDRYALTGLNRLDSGNALHAAYSDGLSTVSLFEQRGSLDPDELGGYDKTTTAGARVYLRYGLPTVAVWESDSTVFTLVTDAPRSAVTDVIRSLPHAQPGDQPVVDRLGTGLQRIGSFVDVRH